MIQPLTDDNGNILSADSDIASEFVKQYGDKDVDVQPDILNQIQQQAEDIIRKWDDEGNNDIINSEITKEEIKKSIMKMRDGTGYNPLEDIDSRMLKNSDDKLHDLLHYMYNTWLTQGDVPDETKVDYKKLHKKPNKTTYNKWKS